MKVGDVVCFGIILVACCAGAFMHGRYSRDAEVERLTQESRSVRASVLSLSQQNHQIQKVLQTCTESAQTKRIQELERMLREARSGQAPPSPPRTVATRPTRTRRDGDCITVPLSRVLPGMTVDEYKRALERATGVRCVLFDVNN